MRIIRKQVTLFCLTITTLQQFAKLLIAKLLTSNSSRATEVLFISLLEVMHLITVNHRVVSYKATPTAVAKLYNITASW